MGAIPESPNSGTTERHVVMTNNSEKLKVVAEDGEATKPIAKPEKKLGLDRFKSKLTSSVSGGVETLQNALPQYSLAGAKDFVRLHPDVDAYWSVELTFVNVPVKGTKRDTLHLIDEDVAKRNGIHQAKLKRLRLALASKPNDVFFLCEVPSRNLDNTWVASNLDACTQATQRWTQALSQKEEGKESYKVDFARNASAFPEPRWPSQTLDEMILKAYDGRMIDDDDHPGIARLVGDAPTVS
jgi:hypothetical protein